MKKYQNKYRNESARLQLWDYGANAAYFITICTTGRQHFFGANKNPDRVGVGVMRSENKIIISPFPKMN